MMEAAIRATKKSEGGRPTQDGAADAQKAKEKWARSNFLSGAE